ncbi:ATP-binding cassette domain-containing protein [Marinobacter nanhaiticus D15-8W]|uniref:ATP-binding cassette domain-containing protein n=1 Tax=Marinobacter nanhaiticus D15-8W TaxID=626887 RepID=N6VZD7_9GAMM|nr:ATP-binding cassette domain-containing protein [Marinobacter nanhaiticus]ENO13224.1 ATP-binding cassette domain-containing protein [Marinobacter nanhaiticus D15-8W]BES70585.1 ATP-binding cassette domain-containing protein [Marinobacter nanhaiticus D15-8W]
MSEPGCLNLDDVAVGELSGVGLTVAPGEIVCISGPSGSGKSRLLRAIADIEAHDGHIRLNGQDQQDMTGHAWRRRVIMVPADSQWWFDSVGEHFPTSLSQDDLKALGFDEDVSDWSISRLSSGERQRLALLRTLVLKPEALLLDEPTSNLDPDRVADVETWLLEQIRSHRIPTLWVAHDPAQIDRVANRHFRLQSGRLEAT